MLDKKSLRAVTGKSADWHELAKDSVAFANATGGRLLIGIEDAVAVPPAEQELPIDLPDLVRRRLSELTVNFVALPEAKTAENGGQYLEITIPRAVAVASTTDGRYFIRIADKSAPVTGDDVLRLASERAALPWETQCTASVSRRVVNAEQIQRLTQGILTSDRVKASVKEKSIDELLEHYMLVRGEYLTNMGVLCVGTQAASTRVAALGEGRG
ncbi:helix-turn-helix domain-containing protein [Caballeronia sp. TF1N1]|uniref:AlbA family DNA-binding domain-containing protein n=1 Tax=Caballeronia sp. TF1N1 TaxID=2878153 RepID=UPI00351D67EE